MKKEIPLTSSSSLRRKNVTLWIGNKKQRNLDSLPTEIIHVVDYLQSTVGTTLVSTKIWKMPSLSSMNSESWELELGLRNSRKSLNEIGGFFSQLLREIHGLTTSQCLWQMVYTGTRLNSKGNTFYTRLTVVSQRLPDTSESTL